MVGCNTNVVLVVLVVLVIVVLLLVLVVLVIVALVVLVLVVVVYVKYDGIRNGNTFFRESDDLDEDAIEERVCMKSTAAFTDNL